MHLITRRVARCISNKQPQWKKTASRTKPIAVESRATPASPVRGESPKRPKGALAFGLGQHPIRRCVRFPFEILQTRCALFELLRTRQWASMRVGSYHPFSNESEGTEGDMRTSLGGTRGQDAETTNQLGALPARYFNTML